MSELLALLFLLLLSTVSWERFWLSMFCWYTSVPSDSRSLSELMVKVVTNIYRKVQTALTNEIAAGLSGMLQFDWSRLCINICCLFVWAHFATSSPASNSSSSTTSNLKSRSSRHFTTSSPAINSSTQVKEFPAFFTMEDLMAGGILMAALSSFSRSSSHIVAQLQGGQKYNLYTWYQLIPSWSLICVHKLTPVLLDLKGKLSSDPDDRKEAVISGSPVVRVRW